MGFIKETYTNGNAGLVVSFAQTENSKNFCTSDSVQEAMEYFNLYLDENNKLRIDSDSERAINTLEVNPEEAADFRAKVDTLLINLTDEQALENAILFPQWNANVDYKMNQRIRYNGVLYIVLQDHTSQKDWLPSAANTLYAKLIRETENGSIPEWTQPDSTNAFMTGDQVMHNGILYTSTADNNVWEPGTTGAPWTAINSEETTTTAVSDWVSGISYMIGDHILYEGVEYESLIDNNVWSPADYPAGWAAVVETEA